MDQSIVKLNHRMGILTVAEATSSRSSSLVERSSTFLRLLRKTTVGWVKVSVVYRSHKVSNFQFSFSIGMKNFDRVTHDVSGHVPKRVGGDCSRKQDDLYAFLRELVQH